jgi:glycogen operon protein
MADQDWNTPYARAMMVFLNGDAITEPGPRGEPVHDDTFLILLSAHNEPVTFTLPGPKLGRRWSVTLDTAAGRAGRGSEGSRTRHRPGGQIVLAGHSMMVLRRTDPAPAPPAPEAG